MRQRTSLTAAVFMVIQAACLVFPLCCFAGFSDRVVAFVDDQAITESEFREQYRNTLKITPDISEEDVLNTMINRILLLREAKKFRIESPTPEGVMQEYIDLKVRALIKVGESDIEKFFKTNTDQFAGREYEEVRGEIERYLGEKELNERLKVSIRELRKNSYIKIQLATK